MRAILEEVKRRLECIVVGDLQVVSERQLGLCYNLPKKFGTKSRGGVIASVASLYHTWEHYSGDATFPIPSESENKTPAHEFYGSWDLWEGYNLKMRQSLCQHILDNFDKFEHIFTLYYDSHN